MKPLTDPKAPPIALLFFVLKKYGVDCLEWDSAILRKELETDFSVKIDDAINDRLMAAIEILTSNEYENDFTVFEWITHLLAEVPSEYGILNPLTVEEIVKGTAQVLLIRHEPIIYHADIRAYLGQVFYEYGFFKTPKLFPDAIMPQYVKANIDEQDEEKNKALDELFDYCINQSVDYIDNLKNITI